MAGKFEVYKDKAGEFRFRLKSGNGENIGSSEGYKAKTGALRSAESVKKNVVYIFKPLPVWLMFCPESLPVYLPQIHRNKVNISFFPWSSNLKRKHSIVFILVNA